MGTLLLSVPQGADRWERWTEALKIYTIPKFNRWRDGQKIKDLHHTKLRRTYKMHCMSLCYQSSGQFFGINKQEIHKFTSIAIYIINKTFGQSMCLNINRCTELMSAQTNHQSNFQKSKSPLRNMNLNVLKLNFHCRLHFAFMLNFDQLYIRRRAQSQHLPICDQSQQSGHSLVESPSVLSTTSCADLR